MGGSTGSVDRVKLTATTALCLLMHGGGGSSLYAIILDVSLVLLGGINSVVAKTALLFF